jgi:hypothetical protein
MINLSNFIKSFAGLVILLLSISCSNGTEEVKRIPFKTHSPKPNTLSDADYFWGDSHASLDACLFLESKKAEPFIESGKTYRPFQLYRSIFNHDKNSFWGSHSITKIPQILFMLSQEGSEDSGPMYRSYDRWTFYLLAKSKLCPLIPSFCEYLNNIDSHQEKLIETKKRIAETSRQKEVVEEEARLARARRDFESLKALNRKLSELEFFEQHLREETKRIEIRIKTLERQIEGEAEHLIEKNDPTSVEVLKYLQNLISINKNWNSAIWNGPVAAYNIKKQFTKGRNGYIEKTLNELVPGALDAANYPLKKSEIFSRYQRYLKNVFPFESESEILSRFGNELEVLRPTLTTEYTLDVDSAPSSSWVQLERDVANAIMLISTPPIDIKDATCKFVISQRLIGQIVAMKGIHQSPKTDGNGFLQRLREDPDHIVEHEDINGIFQVPIDEAWLNKMMLSNAQETPLPIATFDSNTNSALPVEYFAWVNLFGTIAKTANEKFWTEDKLNPLKEELIPADLLKLSFGVMAVGLQAARVHLLKIDVTDISLIPENTPEGFVFLIHATITSLEALEEQYKMHKNKPTMAYLPDQLQADISENGKTYLELTQLLYASTKRAMEFSQDHNTHEPVKIRLREAIHRAGAFLKNEALYLYR